MVDLPDLEILRLYERRARARRRLALLWGASIALAVGAALLVVQLRGRGADSVEALARELRDAPSQDLVDRADEISVLVYRRGGHPELVPLCRRLVRHAHRVPRDEARQWVPILLPALRELGWDDDARRLAGRLRAPAATESIVQSQSRRSKSGRDNAAPRTPNSDPTVSRPLAGIDRPVSDDLVKALVAYQRLNHATAEDLDASLRDRVGALTRQVFERDTAREPRAVRSSYVNRGPLVLELAPRL